MSSKSRSEVQAARAFSLKDYPRAISHLCDLLECVGENPHTLHLLAVCHARQDDLPKALSYVQRALRADDQHLESLKLAAQLHLQRGEQPEARRHVVRALQLHGGDPVEPSELRAWIGTRMHRLFGRAAGNRARGIAESREHRRWLEWAEAFVAAAPPADKDA
jgi:tetratricopeptide (TPR) repeat protein